MQFYVPKDEVYANEGVLTNNIISHSKSYDKNSIAENIMSFNLAKAQINEKKSMSLNECVDLFGMVNAINNIQKERNKNIFSRLWSWFTRNTKKEDDLKKDILNTITAITNCDVKGYAEQDAKEFGRAAEQIADRDRVTKDDLESQKLLGTDPDTKARLKASEMVFHSVTQAEMDKALIDGKNREAELQLKTEQGQKRIDETFRFDVSNDGVDLNETEKIRNDLDRDLGGNNNLSKDEFEQMKQQMQEIHNMMEPVNENEKTN